MKKRTSSKILGVILVCLMMASTFGILPGTVSAAKFSIGDAVRTTNDLNVRDNPGLGSTVIWTQYANTAGEVLEGPQVADGYTWWRIKYDDDVTGWSSDHRLEKYTRPSPKFSIGDSVQTTDKLNVRSKPGTQYAILNTQPAGATGTILDFSVPRPRVVDGYNWWKVHYSDGTQGWSSDHRLEILSISARIDSYSPSTPVEVEVGKSTTISVTFTNTGNTAWNFIAGATVWDSGGNQVVNYSQTLSTALQPGQQKSVSWNHPVNDAGDYWLQFGVWKDTPYTSENLLDKEPSPSQNLIRGIPPPQQPTIDYSPSSFSFSATQGGSNPSSQTLSIRNSGGGALDWSVSDDAGWLSLSPTSGSSTGETDSVAVSVSISGMSVGSYSATITISASEATNTPQTVPVSLTITEESISVPDAPTGPTSSKTNQSLSYSTGGASSNLGHSLEYRFDWGDGSLSGWSSSTSASYSWSTAGTYTVKTQARCATHTAVLSDWSAGLTVEITEESTLTGPLQGTIAFRRDVDGSSEITVINPDGSGLASLSQQGTAPAWSPDGTKIAFVNNNDIYVMNADGTGVARITETPEWEMDPAWSPDGSKIAFARVPPLWQEPADVWIMNANGSGQTQLTSHPAEDRMPSWSPDGAKIAFVSHREGGDIWVMNANGSGQANLIDDADWEFIDEDPAWSPDGSKIAFAADREKRGGRDIYIMNTNGSNITKLTTPVGDNAHPSWSPDGTKIAFASNREGNYDIYIMNADGSGETRLTSGSVDESGPSWGAGVAGVPAKEPDIGDVNSIDFGNVVIGDSLDKTTTIYNQGNATLTVQSITRASGSSDFTYVGPSTPFEVGAGGSQTVALRFAPSSEGTKNATFTIDSDDPDEGNVTFDVSGNDVSQTGTIQVTSNLSGAPFSLSGPANYSGTTPQSKADAPVGTYTITWGPMSGFETPPSETKTLTQGRTISFYGLYQVTPLSATIDTYSIFPRNVTVGETITISFTFTNTSYVSHTFGAGATLRKPDGTEIDFLKPVTVALGESGSAQWTYTIDMAGRWDTVFGVWEQSTHPLENLLVQTGWVPEYITATTVTDYPLAKWIESPNYTPAEQRDVTYIIIHVMEGYFEDTVNRFKNEASNVSAHYLVSQKGEIVQMVREKDIAWHAGNWEYNQRSIGIEHEDQKNWDKPNWATEELYQSSAALVRYLCEKYGIPKDRAFIIGHNEVPGVDKPCPGTYWDWDYFMSLVKGIPFADAGQDQSVSSGDLVTFNASNSYDPDGTIISYRWDFGDGTKKEGKIVSHRFRGAQNEARNYTVTLTVVDDMGATAVETINVIVKPLEKIVSVSPGYLGEQYASMKASYNWVGVDETTGEDLYIISEIIFSTTGIVGVYQLFITREAPLLPIIRWQDVIIRSFIEVPYHTPFTPTIGEFLGVWSPDLITEKIFPDSVFEGIEVRAFDVMSIVVSASALIPPVYVDTDSTAFHPGASNEPANPVLKEVLDLLIGILYSPAELRVYDSQGRVTGLVNGETREEIPYSVYDEENKIVTIIFATDSYRYEVVGTDEGAYGLTVASVTEGDVTTFNLTNVPTSARAVHQYTIDWDALPQGEKGVTMQVDADGDGTFEQTTIIQPPIASFAYSPMSPVVTEQMTFDASESYDVDGSIISYEWDFGDGGTSSGRVVTHSYVAIGDYYVTLTVVDNDGAVSNYSRAIQVREKEEGLPAWVWIPIGLAGALLVAAFVAWHRMTRKQAIKLRAQEPPTEGRT